MNSPFMLVWFLHWGQGARMTNSDAIECLKDKPRSEWLIEDWEAWGDFCQAHASECQKEFINALKENLKLKHQIQKYENFISQKFGMPKRNKTQGLLSAPRGRPMRQNQNQLVSDVVKSLRAKGDQWIEIQDKIDLLNLQQGTSFPKSIRYLRGLIK